jgi:hypothetical protein
MAGKSAKIGLLENKKTEQVKLGRKVSQVIKGEGEASKVKAMRGRINGERKIEKKIQNWEE